MLQMKIVCIITKNYNIMYIAYLLCGAAQHDKPITVFSYFKSHSTVSIIICLLWIAL